MTDTIIRVENLGKNYRIGARENANYSLRESLTGFFSRPFRAMPGRKATQNDEESFWALREISFEVKQGEVVGIIGHNGAGKSTLLKILSRITAPTEGRAEIYGRVSSLLEVGTGFSGELTGRENIYLNGSILGMRKREIDRKFDDIVGFAEVEKFIDTPVKRYSTGMYLRLAFAVAAHLEPEVLVVDEVLAVGDAAFQQKCLGKMGDIAAGGRTVLFVSHNMQVVSQLCQRGLLLQQGQLRLDAEVATTVSQYLQSLQKYQRPQNGFVSLVEHPGRTENFDNIVRLTYCRLEDENRNPVDSFHCGRAARVVIGYEHDQSSEVLTQFSLNFVDTERRRVFCCLTDVVGDNLQCQGRGEAECLVPRLPLMPGKYTLNLGCWVGNSPSDGIGDAVQFDVVGSDFHPTGRMPTSLMAAARGAVLVDYSWTSR